MKKLIIVGTISLLSATAFANDKTLGESSEYYGSPLLDHNNRSTSQTLPINHDHGDDATSNFVDHDHEQMLAEHAAGHPGKMPAWHDHGDDTTQNYVEHKEE